MCLWVSGAGVLSLHIQESRSRPEKRQRNLHQRIIAVRFFASYWPEVQIQGLLSAEKLFSLHLAVQRRNFDIKTVPLEAEAESDVHNEIRSASNSLRCSVRNSDVVHHLKAQGADVNHGKNNGWRVNLLQSEILLDVERALMPGVRIVR
jgi:hypothetical protein